MVAGVSSQKRILVLGEEQNPWLVFLQEYFEDTRARVGIFSDAAEAGSYLDQRGCDVAFVVPGCLSFALAQKLKLLRASFPTLRLFQIGNVDSRFSNLPYDEVFEEPNLEEFQKKLNASLPFPECIRVLVIDDDPEIGRTVRDFLEFRTHPSFEVRLTSGGKQGLEQWQKDPPDVVVLDIKMPDLSGREVFCQMRKRGIRTPVIVFFDAVSEDELTTMRQIDHFAIVEKSTTQSAMSEMMSMIKKMAYFG